MTWAKRARVVIRGRRPIAPSPGFRGCVEPEIVLCLPPVDPTRVDPRTTVGLFLRQAARLGSRPMIRYHRAEGWQEISWDRMRTLALRVAAHLVAEGVLAGERVALMSENRFEWLYCDLGIQAAGAITVPIYPTSTAEVANRIAADTGVRLGFVSGPALAERLQVERLVRMDGELLRWVEEEADPILVQEVGTRCLAVHPDDVATIIPTSGTTGIPKGVMLAHRCLVDMARICVRTFEINEDDVALSLLPYAHVFERVNSFLVMVAAGGSMWLSRGADRVLEDLGECRPTVMVSVPRMYEKMHQGVSSLVRRQARWRRLLVSWAVEQGRRRARGRRSPFHWAAHRLVLSQLRQRLTGGRLRFFVSGGAPLALEVEEFFWAIGVKILQGWGMTETSSGATSNREHHHRFGTVGTPLPGVEVRVAEDGEILVKSPGNMLGYHGDPEGTAEVLVDGWLRTGDVGELDSEGFLRITDRKKDLIKTAGGKYVAPQPLEARLQDDPLVERAVVIGDERPYCVALIVPDWQAVRDLLGLEGDPERLVEEPQLISAVQRCVDELNRSLGSWETLKSFRLLPRDLTEEAGELTPTLKVRRRVVQERYRDLIETMYRRSIPPGESDD
jgi:long-chain acyl-CoA synthetase